MGEVTQLSGDEPTFPVNYQALREFSGPVVFLGKYHCEVDGTVRVMEMWTNYPNQGDKPISIIRFFSNGEYGSNMLFTIKHASTALDKIYIHTATLLKQNWWQLCHARTYLFTDLKIR